MDADLPSTLNLKQVLVMHRHGERVPVRDSARIHAKGSASHEALWRQCAIAPFLHALHSVLALDKDRNQSAAVAESHAFAAKPPLFPPVVGEIEILHGREASQHPLFSQSTWRQMAVTDGYCSPGQLTDKGKMTMMNLGASLRAHYTEKLGFLPHILTSEFMTRNMYIRSTGYVRTVESVQYLLAGLFPFHTRPHGRDGDIKIHVANTENMYIDMGCRRLVQILKPFRESVKARTQGEVTELMAKFEHLFPKNASPEADNGVSSTPGAPARPLTAEEKRLKQFNLREIDLFYDTFKCMASSANDPTLPRGVTTADLDRLGFLFMENFIGGIADAATQRGDADLARTVKRLLIGRFWGDLLGVMEERVGQPLEHPNAMRLGVFSGHDTTIGPLLVSLGVFEGAMRKWPQFAANITIEMFEDTGKEQMLSTPTREEKGEGHFVRVKYDGVPMKLSFCAAKGSHYVGDPSLCTYKAFTSALAALVPSDYARECCAL
ncbi:histidine phosphatase superfamily [Chytriomyces sp. MP71]|nr:histidine phosphatase superfamily [Chytriomyces sp. MP71]